MSVLWPFSSAVAIQDTVRETFTQSMSVIEAHMRRIIIEAEASLGFLNGLEERLFTLHEYIARENTTLIGERDDLLAELWTRFGGNRKQLRGIHSHLFLLKSIGVYRRRSMTQVSAALQTLQGMSEDMEDLRELGQRIPVEVHLQSIKGGMERLQANRKRMKKHENEAVQRILTLTHLAF